MISSKPNPEVECRKGLTEIQEFLNRFHIFSGAPAGVVSLFAYLARKESYGKGQVILEKGMACDRCLLILSGQVDIFQYCNGRRFHLQLLKEEVNNYFGELALLSQSQLIYSARAWTDVQLLSISREAFTRVMERYPDSYHAMVQKIISSHIQRSAEQSSYLLDHIDPGAWREDPPAME